MASRLELQSLLEKFLGNRNVYYKPPENLKITFPAIVYTVDKIENTKADDVKYLTRKRYSITVIDRSPDNKAIEKILELPYSSFDRNYKADNLNHDVITLYF